MTQRNLIMSVAAAMFSLVAAAPGFAEEHEAIEHQPWSFGGITGQFDRAQLQRGFQVYREVCSACHGLKRLSFRNLSQPGGPEFPEEAVKKLALEWPNQIVDGPNAEGKMFERPALPSDPIRGPYHNDQEARANQNGSLPPDLTLIPRARNIERSVSWVTHPFYMLYDILTGYQEGGADYVYALLTGFTDPPKDMQMAEGKMYNKVFPGHQIGMPPPLSDDVVIYKDGTPNKVENYARDVTAFLSWTADPALDQRKRMGWQVVIYLLITTALLYLGKRSIWSSIKH